MYTTTPLADADVLDIYVYGAGRYGTQSAEDYVSGLREVFFRLADNPRIARERTEVRPPVRLYVHRAHVVLYEIDDEDVVILRVLHGSVDWISRLGMA